MARPKVDPNTDDAPDTMPLGNRSPRFRKPTDAEALELLTADPAPDVAALPDHALDLAPPNSKIVVVPNPDGGRLAVLATCVGPVKLPPGDPAHRLPIGSRVYKTPEGYFAARLPAEYAHAAPPLAQSGRAAEVLAHINAHLNDRVPDVTE